ncbi:MAG: DinB family protein [Bacteroidetes bacterium]|nr:DinB family protein [Bacteroidota bacterium]
MRYLLLVLLGTFSLGASAQSDAAYVTEMQKKWANAKTYTLALAEAMPPEQYGFRPVAGEMSFAEQMAHLSANMVWLSSSYLSDEKPPQDLSGKEALHDATKADIVKIVERSMDYAALALQKFDPARLNEPVKFFAGPMTRRQIIALLNDHLTHHRAQAIVYLRLNGVIPPQYVGW